MCVFLHSRHCTIGNTLLLSDVWSYGALMYEIWSLGHKPFEAYTNHQAGAAWWHLWLNIIGLNLIPRPCCVPPMCPGYETTSGLIVHILFTCFISCAFLFLQSMQLIESSCCLAPPPGCIGPSIGSWYTAGECTVWAWGNEVWGVRYELWGMRFGVWG